MLLKDKTATLYGASGPIGRAVAQAFAREGAQLFLTGRDSAPLERFAKELTSTGGKAQAAQVDALDAEAVEAHLAAVVDQTGRVDISFNMISLQDSQGRELTEMSIDDYVRPIDIAARTQFITATGAARHMVKRGRGVIMAITATLGRQAHPGVGGFGAACGTIEGIMRTLAAEVGPKGVRVCWLRSVGSPDAPGVDKVFREHASKAGISLEEFKKEASDQTLLHRMPKLSEVGDMAALIASDHASAMTGAAGNVTCGQLVD